MVQLHLPLWPLMEIVVEVDGVTGQERLDAALAALAADDASFSVYRDQESGLTVMAGMTEDQLDAKASLLLNRYNLAVSFGAPQVAYRETITSAVKIEGASDEHDGIDCQSARVGILFEPGEQGSGFVFKSLIAADLADTAVIAAVHDGIESARHLGLLAGFPAIAFEATLIEATGSGLGLTMKSFEFAARHAFGQLRTKGAPVLLEPVMTINVVTPEAFIGDVLGDLNLRRGLFTATGSRPNGLSLTADVPLSNLFGYKNTLDHISDGRASFTMAFSHYDRVPQIPGPPDDLYPPAIGMRA